MGDRFASAIDSSCHTARISHQAKLAIGLNLQGIEAALVADHRRLRTWTALPTTSAGRFCPLGPRGLVGLELREIMGLAVAVDDLHIAHVSLDPLLGKLDRIEWAVRLRSKAYTIRGEPSYEVP